MYFEYIHLYIRKAKTVSKCYSRKITRVVKIFESKKNENSFILLTPKTSRLEELIIFRYSKDTME